MNYSSAIWNPFIIPDDVAGGGNHSDLSLSEVLAGAGAEDSTFQQLTQSGDLLEGLEFPVDVLSQLPATPPRPAGVPATGLPPPSTVRPAWEQGYCTCTCRGSSVFFGKVTTLGVWCFFALCCLYGLACFFLPSFLLHLSLTCNYYDIVK